MWRFLKKDEKKAGCSSSKEDPELEESINREIEKIRLRRPRLGNKNIHYTPEIRYKIGKYAAEYGNVFAIRKFSKEMAKEIPESSVRNMKKEYLKSLKDNPEQKTNILPLKKKGRTLKLGHTLDNMVKK